MPGRPGAPSVHAHKVDMSCACPRGGMRPNPPHWQYRRGDWEASWSQQEGHLSASLFTPPLRPVRKVPCVRAAKPSWNSRALGLGGAVGVLKRPLALSTISSTASSRNLDTEQSTVTWTRYLSSLLSCVFGSASLLSQDVSLPHSPSARIAVQKRNRAPSQDRKEESLTVCCLRTLIIISPVS